MIQGLAWRGARPSQSRRASPRQRPLGLCSVQACVETRLSWLPFVGPFFVHRGQNVNIRTFQNKSHEKS